MSFYVCRHGTVREGCATCTCGIEGSATDAMRKNYGDELHSPYCPVGRRAGEQARA